VNVYSFIEAENASGQAITRACQLLQVSLAPTTPTAPPADQPMPALM
jgi:hypothetical protein